MTAISKNVYFDVLNDIANKQNNTVHKSIKMKPIDITNNSYAEYNENSNLTYNLSPFILSTFSILNSF